MKPCPYCLEEIKDDAVRCRFCTSDLTAPADQVLARPPAPVQRAVAGGLGVGAGSGEGRGPDRGAEPARVGAAESPPTPQPQPPPSPTPSPTPSPSPQPQPPQPQPPQAEPQPVERTKVIPMPTFPQSGQPAAAQGGAGAPAQTPVGAPAGGPGGGAQAGMAQGGGAQPGMAPGGGAPAGAPQAGRPTASPAVPQIMSPARTPSPSPSLTFSHEGPRYILGYSSDYFGLWDKAAPGPPVQRFPRTEQGWQMAWEAFMRSEMGVAGG